AGTHRKNFPANRKGRHWAGLSVTARSGSVEEVVEHVQHQARGQGDQHDVAVHPHPDVAVRRRRKVVVPVVQVVVAGIERRRHAVAHVPDRVVVATRVHVTDRRAVPVLRGPVVAIPAIMVVVARVVHALPFRPARVPGGLVLVATVVTMVSTVVSAVVAALVASVVAVIAAVGAPVTAVVAAMLAAVIATVVALLPVVLAVGL